MITYILVIMSKAITYKSATYLPVRERYIVSRTAVTDAITAGAVVYKNAVDGGFIREGSTG